MSMPPQQPPKLEKFKELKYRILREPWNRYLIDPTAEIIKLRWVLTRLFVEPTDDLEKIGVLFKHQQLVVVTNVPKLDYSDKITQPMPHPSTWKDHITQLAEFEVKKEEWNEYQFKFKGQEFRLRIKNSLNDIHRTDIITMDREPMFICNHDTKVSVRKII